MYSKCKVTMKSKKFRLKSRFVNVSGMLLYVKVCEQASSLLKLKLTMLSLRENNKEKYSAYDYGLMRNILNIFEIILKFYQKAQEENDLFEYK